MKRISPTPERTYPDTYFGSPCMRFTTEAQTQEPQVEKQEGPAKGPINRAQAPPEE